MFSPVRSTQENPMNVAGQDAVTELMVMMNGYSPQPHNLCFKVVLISIMTEKMNTLHSVNLCLETFDHQNLKEEILLV